MRVARYSAALRRGLIEAGIMQSCGVEQAQRFHRSPPDLYKRPHNDRLGATNSGRCSGGSAMLDPPYGISDPPGTTDRPLFHGEPPSLRSPLVRAFTALRGSTGSTITSHPRHYAAASLKPGEHLCGSHFDIRYSAALRRGLIEAMKTRLGLREFYGYL